MMTEHCSGEGRGDTHTHTNNDGEKYRSELTVEVEVEGTEKITVMDILKEVKAQCGEVVGCRMKGEKAFEITMKDNDGREKIMDGLRVRNNIIHARTIINDDMTVSFINLPIYIEDCVIIQKLTEWGVTPISQIRRRKWPGTDIADGTRFLRVRFNDKVRSLPYSTKFETLRGPEYVRVIHDRQVRVCRLCIKPGHIFRECPEFKCFRCQKTGHYARECQERAETERPEEREENGQAGEDGTTGGERAEETRPESGSEMEEQDGEEGKETEEDETQDETHEGEESAMEEEQSREAGEGRQKAEGEKGKEKKTKGKSKKTLGGSGEKRDNEDKMREGEGEGRNRYEDITDSDENKWEELIATRKRPLGRKEREGKGKKKNTR